MHFSQELKKEAFDFAFAVHRVTDLFSKDEAVRRQLREYSSEILAKVSSLEFTEDYEKRAIVYGTLSNLEALKSLILLSVETGLMRAINAEVLKRECLALEIYFKHELGELNRVGAVKDKEPAGKRIVQNDIAVRKHISEGFINDSRENADNLKKSIKNINNKNSSRINDTKLSVNDILEAQVQRGESQAPVVSHDIIDSAMAEEVEGGESVNERQKAIIGYLQVNKEAKMGDLVTIFSNRFSVKTLQRDISCLIMKGTVERRGDKRWAVYTIK